MYPDGVYSTAPGNTMSSMSECPTKIPDAGEDLRPRVRRNAPSSSLEGTCPVRANRTIFGHLFRLVALRVVTGCWHVPQRTLYGPVVQIRGPNVIGDPHRIDRVEQAPDVRHGDRAPRKILEPAIFVRHALEQILADAQPGTDPIIERFNIGIGQLCRRPLGAPWPGLVAGGRFWSPHGIQ